MIEASFGSRIERRFPRQCFPKYVWFIFGCMVLWSMAPGSLQAQPTELPGLTGDASVVFDNNGIPHICAGNDRDVAFMQGYLHARDRFFQMDLLRRTFSGTLAELVGSAALTSDVQFRTFGLRRAAEASVAAYQDAGLNDTLAFMEAYSRGVNIYLANNPLPPEYGALELTQAQPWSVVDVIVMGKGLAFGLSFDLVELDLTVLAGAYGQAGAVAGFDGLTLLFEDVVRSAPFDPTISIPEVLQATLSTPSKVANSLAVPEARTAALAKSYRDHAASIPVLDKALDRRSGDTGSNWWLVSGDRSATGYPMLANDPHLALNTPATFYEAHLIVSSEPGCGLGQTSGSLVFQGDRREKVIAGADMNANGVSFAGAAGLVQGCNESMCWGSTVHPMDVTDVYQEVFVIDPNTGLPSHTIFDGQPEPLVVIPQVFLVNVVGDQVADNLVDGGVGPADGGLTFVVPRRNNGPVIAFDFSADPAIGFSVQYTGWSGTTEFGAFHRWLTTENVDDFVDALQYFDVGSQNWAYADVNGNIAYFTSAELPIREDLQTLGFPDGGIPPFLIRDGTHTLKHEWMAVQNPQPRQSLGYEILPFEEMPQIRNPAKGYIINANNDPVGNALDNNVLNEVRPGGGVYYLSPGYTSLRVGRIERLMEELLADGNKATADDLKVIQGNNQLLDGEILLPFLLAAFDGVGDGAPAELMALVSDAGIQEAISRLRAWDYSSPTGLQEGYDPGDAPDQLVSPEADEVANSVATTLWSVFRGQITRNVMDATLTGIGLADFLPGSTDAYRAVAHLLETFDTNQGIGASGVDFFQTGLNLSQAQERDYVLLSSLRDALDLLAGPEFDDAFSGSANQEDYRWGLLHRIVFDHPLGGPFNVPNAGGFSDVSPLLPGVARAGGYEAVDASRHSARAAGSGQFMFGAGPARRFVGTLDPAGIQADQIIPGGQSGVVSSPDYASQLGRWLTNRYHPLLLSAEAVDANAVSQQDFTSACVPGRAQLCLQNRRFRATVDWNAALFGGPGFAVPGASNLSGNLYFFDAENWEMLIKVLDGCAENGNYWVFASGATDLAWTLTVEDTFTGEVWSASNPLGQRSPAITATDAFSCQ